jgi:radical SAM protein with 4Fe4S-binding SPASM domain
MFQYVGLANCAIFKSRYGQWYLINTSLCERERILVEGGTEKVLLFLFAGNSIESACESFSLERTELSNFLQTLVDEGVIIWCQISIDSTDRCYDIYPPLDCLNALLTNACNLHCAHCYLSSGKPAGDELTGDEWVHILKEARSLGVFELNVTGGEAMLHRDFMQIAEYIASVPTFNANLNTNGTLLKREHEEIIVHTFTSVQVSIDHSVAAKHDKFRGKEGSFERSVATIRKFVDCGTQTNIGFALNHNNLEALDDVISLAEDLGVTVLNIGLIADLGRARDNQLVRKLQPTTVQSDPFMEAVYHKIKELTDRSSRVQFLLPFRVPIKNEVHEPHEKNFICDGENTQIVYVMSNGNVMPCDKLPVDMFSCGNVRRHSLLVTWSSQRMKEFKLMSPRQLPICESCPHLKICGGACVARAYQSGGSIDSPDWTSCVIAQKLAQDNLSQR